MKVAALRSAHPRLLGCWTDDPADPGRLPVDHTAVQQLAAAIAPGARLTDLGGVYSLNARLDPAGLVLRVHQPPACVSRPRLLAVQEVRRRLAHRGLRVPVAVPWRGATVFRCGSRWAELEGYVPAERLAPEPGSYLWLYGAMGALHRALTALDLRVPRPLGATYAPPGSVRRWLPVTEGAVLGDPEAEEVARLVRDLTRRLRRQWVPAAALPVQLVHGDVRPSNVRRTPSGEVVYFDFGFLARRPRIHDLAYGLAFMVWALDALPAPERFPWGLVPQLLSAYEATAPARLTAAERAALVPYTAAVPLYYAALDGFTEDPAGKLRSRLPFLRLSAWLLAHPEAVCG
jgi:Ser/Thr protein kinase RdoA (MazF antagonist)